ncbi:hypothetical protein PR048_010344 [Dryococelus australis]|uniref:Uncharacterized protein n=1 Tax=Dryococelus australis TaxID=614101 RepID=A0ABQ9I2F2_9NEOP|nr:hypothetical protein PR048_010344 [Dryococelus australis]
MELAQELISAGVTYGHVSAANVLTRRNTVARHVGDIARRLRDEIIPNAQSAEEQKACAVTVVLWPEDFMKMHYLTVTARYNDQLVNKALMTRFPDVRKCGDNIRAELQNHLTEFRIAAEVLQNVIFVTDQGPNIRKGAGDLRDATVCSPLHQFSLAAYTG